MAGYICMRPSVLILGALGMLAQAAFLREILSTFRGGELTIGAALLFWMLWTAAGSGLSGGAARRIAHPERWFHAILPLYGVLGYLGVALTGSAPFLFQLVPGESAPYDIQFLTASVTMLPFNLLGGFLFGLGAKSLERGKHPSAGSAYTLEAFGAAIAGILSSLVLAGFLSNRHIALLVPLAAFAVSTVWALRSGSLRVLTALAPASLLLTGAITLDFRADGYFYRGQQLVAQEETRFSRLRVTRSCGQVTFYSDASVLFSVPNPEASEYIVHFPMLTAREPRRVLALGGGPGGVIGEILKYRTVARVTAVELDPGVFALAGRYLKNHGENDARVRTVAMDGRAFLERTGERYDVIVMSMPAPLSGTSNRYYTREFFRLAASRLEPGGVFGFSLPAAEDFISPDMAFSLASVRATLRSAFPSVALLPGIEVRFLASTEPGRFDSLTWERMESNRAAFGIETAYVRDYFLRYTMSPERMAFLRESLNQSRPPEINTDTRPSGYFRRTLLQGSLDRSRITRGLDALSQEGRLPLLMGGVTVLLLLPGLIPGRGARQRTVTSAVLAAGLTQISLQVLAILAYQSFFGFLYSRIALLTGSYMAGLAAGGLHGVRQVERAVPSMSRLAMVQGGIALIAAFWRAVLLLGDHGLSRGIAMETGFILLTALTGLLGGWLFPIADSLYRQSRTVAGIGAVYGLDMAGAAVGAILTAALVIPVLGMYPALGWLTAVNLLAAGMSMRKSTS